jgi:hypothetical protein
MYSEHTRDNWLLLTSKFSKHYWEVQKLEYHIICVCFHNFIIIVTYVIKLLFLKICFLYECVIFRVNN